VDSNIAYWQTVGRVGNLAPLWGRLVRNYWRGWLKKLWVNPRNPPTRITLSTL